MPSLLEPKDYITSAQLRAASVTNTVLLASVALLIVWVSSIERQTSDAGAIIVAKEKLRADSLFYKSLLERDMPSTATSRAHRSLARRVEMVADTMAKEQRVLKEQIAEVEFHVFGLDFSMPPKWAPVGWLGMVAGLLLYLRRQRSIFHALAGRGIRASGIDTNTEPKDVPVLFLMTPLWAAPIPFRKGEALRTDQVRAAFGWTSAGDWMRNIALFLAFIGVLLLSARAAMVSQVMLSAYSGQGTLWLPWLGVAISAAIILGTVLLWWFPDEVPDDYAKDHGVPELGKRQFMKSIVTAGVGAVLFTGFIRLSAQVVDTARGIQARGRKKRVLPIGTTTLAAGFYINEVRPRNSSRSAVAKPEQVIHYVDSSHQVYNALPAPKQLRPVPVGELINYRFANPILSRSFESAARDMLKQSAQDWDAICALLIDGVKLGMRNSQPVDRLADLCAVCAVRHGLKPRLDELCAAITDSRTETSAALRSSIDKWRNPKSKWNKNWSKGKRTWSGLPM